MKKYGIAMAMVVLSATLVGCGSDQVEIKISDVTLDGKEEVTQTVAYLTADEANKFSVIYDEVRNNIRILPNSPTSDLSQIQPLPQFSHDASDVKAAYDDYIATATMLQNKKSMSIQDKKTIRAKHDAYQTALGDTYPGKAAKAILSSPDVVVTKSKDMFLKLEYKEGKPFAYIATQKESWKQARNEIYNVKGIREILDVEEIRNRLVFPEKGTINKDTIAQFSLFNKVQNNDPFEASGAMASMIRRQDEYKNLLKSHTK